jgi:hypothetical protein
MKFSAYLVARMQQTMAQFELPLLTHRDALLKNLVFSWHCMKASENLLKQAKLKSKGKLKAYFAEHLDEERGHEDWLAADLLTAGIDVHKTPIPRLAVEMVGTQYYLINHVDPAALLGYMARHECFPASLVQIELLEKVHGKELLRCARYHALNDVAHGQELLNITDELPQKSQSLILENAIQSATYFGTAQQSFGS